MGFEPALWCQIKLPHIESKLHSWVAVSNTYTWCEVLTRLTYFLFITFKEKLTTECFKEHPRSTFCHNLDKLISLGQRNVFGALQHPRRCPHGLFAFTN